MNPLADARDHGHCNTPPTSWQMRPSGRTSAPPTALVRVPSEPQHPLLSQWPVNVGRGAGSMVMMGEGSAGALICPAADGTAIGAR